MNEIIYPYKPKLFPFILIILFMLAVSVGMGYAAAHNQKKLLLFHTIHLSTQQANVLYGLFSVLFVMTALWLVVWIVRFTRSQQTVILAEDGITVPTAGISHKVVTIKFADITYYDVNANKGKRFVTVLHKNGKLSIFQSFLPHRQAFDELVTIISDRMPRQ